MSHVQSVKRLQRCEDEDAEANTLVPLRTSRFKLLPELHGLQPTRIKRRQS